MPISVTPHAGPAHFLASFTHTRVAAAIHCACFAGFCFASNAARVISCHRGTGAARIVDAWTTAAVALIFSIAICATRRRQLFARFAASGPPAVAAFNQTTGSFAQAQLQQCRFEFVACCARSCNDWLAVGCMRRGERRSVCMMRQCRSAS